MTKPRSGEGDIRRMFGVDTPELLRLLVALFGGPIAWSLHLLVCYFLVALACTTGWQGSGMAVGIATAVLALAATGSGALAYRRWPRRGDDARWATALGESREQRELVLVVGMLLAALSTIGILFAGVAPIFVPTCA